LQGGVNTCFFHSIANGRRKCTVHSLESEEGEIFETIDLRKHIEEYYKRLFCIEERGVLRLDREFWDTEGSVYR
jgi:hypothetical protein